MQVPAVPVQRRQAVDVTRRGRGGGGNRTDLLVKDQPVQAPTGLPYGEAQQLQQAQQGQAVPQPQTPPQSLDVQAHQAAQNTQPPSQLIHAPTERPDEPLTTGLPTGPGAGPAVLGSGDPNADPAINALKGLVARYPSRDLNALLAEHQASQSR